MKEETLRLVHKAIKGSNTAYGELIAEYQVYLYKTAFLYLKNEADSLDAVQECVTRGLLGIKKLRFREIMRKYIPHMAGIRMSCMYMYAAMLHT